MKCPECGRDIPDGSLFCEHCAAEIKIVPEYEARLEEQISSGMESVTRVFDEEEGKVRPHETESAGGELSYHTGGEKAPGAEPGDPSSVTDVEEVSSSPKPQLTPERLEAAARRKARYEARRRKVTLMMVFLVGAITAAVVLVVLYIFVFSRPSQPRNVSYYVGVAYQYAVEEQYEEAAAAIEEALALNEEDTDDEMDYASLYLLASEYYQLAGLCDAALEAGYAILGLEELSIEDEIAAYGQLIAVYTQMEDYESIADLLAGASDETVTSSYSQYMLCLPEFTQEEGEYADLLTVEIHCDGDGTVFYTLDGSEPTTSSNIYKGPIELSIGSHTISAVYVNRFGVMSGIVTSTYEIVSSVPDAPVITPNSGTYVKQMQITATLADPEDDTGEEEESDDEEDDTEDTDASSSDAGNADLSGLPDENRPVSASRATGKIYYTTDGTDPTLESKEYTGPISMPEGDSVYRFAVITEDGVSSEVVEREYTYRITSSLSEEDGVNYILVALIRRGEVVDTVGTVPGGTAYFSFEYQGIEQLEGSGNYLIYEESLVDYAGNVALTGRIYAVNAANGTVNLYTDGILTPIG